MFGKYLKNMLVDNNIFPDSHSSTKAPVGRFAPSPSGRMHLGNIASALISYLSTKSKGGKWILRIEDLDSQRSKPEYIALIEDDLQWLGLIPDEGGSNNMGNNGPYRQSMRHHIYKEFLAKLKPLTYPCTCTRAEIHAARAPHATDNIIRYPGTCRPPHKPNLSRKASTRIIVPDETIHFTDRLYGSRAVNLADSIGDFVLQRADGEWAYQLAVVVDDALMGVNEVVRGADLLDSSAQQIFLYNALGFKAPSFAHIPLLVNANGQRLSKRDKSLDMDSLRQKFSAEEILGYIANLLHLTADAAPITIKELVASFSWDKIPVTDTLTVTL